MAIYVTGDTHGADKFGFHSVDGFVNRLNMESFPEQKFMTKEDYVVICGDLAVCGIMPEKHRKKNMTWTGWIHGTLRHFLCREITKITTA